MAKPLRIGSLIDIDRPFPDIVAQLRRFADAGFDHAFAVQIFGPDTLTLLAAAGAQVPGIGLGTGRRPGLPPAPHDAGPAGPHRAGGDRRPARSWASACPTRWWSRACGASASTGRPATCGSTWPRSCRSCAARRSASAGERVTTNAFAPARHPRGHRRRRSWWPRSGTAMLEAGRARGRRHRHLDDRHPTVGDAHRAHHPSPRRRRPAGPSPASACPCPSRSPRDVDAAKERIDEAFAIYPSLPSYRAMLDKEGARGAADVAFVGDEETVAAAIGRLADAGATDFVASIVGDAEERARGLALLSELARSLTGGPAQRASVVCLNSLRSGCVVEEVAGRPRTVRRARARVALRAAHQAHEHSAAADHEGRDPEDLPLGHRLLVGTADLLDRAPARASATTFVAGQAHPVERAAPPPRAAAGQARRRGGRRRGRRGLEEAVGVLVAHDHARRQRQEVLRLRRGRPTPACRPRARGPGSGEGQERHVPVGSVLQCDHQVLVGVAGEGAAVVPGDGELASQFFNTTSVPGHSPAAPTPAPAAASLRPGRDEVDEGPEPQPEHRADHGPAHHVGRVMGAQVDPAGGHGGRRSRRRPPSRRRGPPGRTPCRTRRGCDRSGSCCSRGRRTGGLQVVVGPLALDGRLHGLADEQRREARRAQRHDGPAPVGSPPAGL